MQVCSLYRALRTLPFCCCCRLKVCGHPEQSEPAGTFFQQHLLTSCLCPVSVTPVTSQTLHYHRCIVTPEQWALTLLLWLFRYSLARNVFNEAMYLVLVDTTLLAAEAGTGPTKPPGAGASESVPTGPARSPRGQTLHGALRL